MTLIGGTSDPQCTDQAWEGWGRCTTGEVEHLRFPGDHFFLHSQAAALAQALLDRIGDTLRNN